ncbi:MAG: HPr(Ser) kinase/phosphatase [Eubacterium sp.]|nr:HPr(Ser) kinase/phosphatase [Eubacterium sp.]
MDYIRLNDLVEKLELIEYTPEMDMEDRRIYIPEVNRPAIQLTGFFKKFQNKRVQVIGNVEILYMNSLKKEEALAAYENLVSRNVPCVIFTNSLRPYKDILAINRKYNVPAYGTPKKTSPFEAELIRYLSEELAPTITLHGVLVDVFGEGVLLMGESGIGKSEAALELVKRGHRLISDDAVEIRKFSEDILVGTAPDITRHFIELRGTGIIDVKTLFGVEAVEETHEIDVIIKLVEWDNDATYNRLGLDKEYTEILGNKVVTYTIPIRPGRNVAVITETTALNHRQKKMGYDAAAELTRRIQERILEKRRQKE